MPSESWQSSISKSNLEVHVAAEAYVQTQSSNGETTHIQNNKNSRKTFRFIKSRLKICLPSFANFISVIDEMISVKKDFCPWNSSSFNLKK